MPSNAITCGKRTFVALRKTGRARPGYWPIYHAVSPYCRPALCADEPSAGSSWAEPPHDIVTCPACLKRLTQLQ